MERHVLVERVNSRPAVQAASPSLAIESFPLDSFPDVTTWFCAWFEQSPDAVFLYADGRLRHVNTAMARLLGYAAPADLVGLRAEDIVAPEDFARLDAYRKRRQAGLPAEDITVDWVRADGSRVSVRRSGALITYRGVPGELVIARDLTGDRRMQEERDEAVRSGRMYEARYRTMFDATPVPVLVFDPETTRILEVNEAAVHTYGWTRDELLAMRVLDLKEPSDAADTLARIAQDCDKARKIGLTRYRRRDGVFLDMEVTAHDVLFDGRRARLAMCLDVTEQRRLEEKVRQAQRMEAVGLLAGGIAHDFNNILATILTCAELAAESITEGAAQEDLREIAAAAQRAATLTNQLLVFSRQQPTARKEVDLAAVVRERSDLFARVLGPRIELDVQVTGDGATVLGDREQLEQVIENLLANARDALPAGGRVRMEIAAEAQLDGLDRGEWVRLSVVDDGVGMDDVTRERAFDPFFTTKGIGKSGLGLAIVFAVVKECGGHVTVSSSRGAGTRVDVFLPRVVRRAMNVNTARGNGGEHVLLVDDDPSILRAMTRTLTALGYEVDAAEGPLRALERARDPRVPIDLVIADVAMPDMNGVAMMNEVRRARPGLRALFVSGYSDRSAMHESLAADDRLLAKPFTRAALGAAVRASLDVNATK